MRVLLPISLDRWRNPIATLLRACVEANPDIEFYSYSSPFSDEDKQLAKQFWSRANVHAMSQVKLASLRYDIVHTASITLHNLLAVLASKLRSIGCCKYLATINLEVGSLDGNDWQLLRCAELLADELVSVSHAAGKGSQQRCADRYRGKIPNGFDSRYFDPTIVDEEVLPLEVQALRPGSYALYVGALEPRKHPELIVELAKRNPDCVFVAAGYIHPMGRHFEAMIKSLKNLFWLGHVDRRCIRALMRKAGVFLFPSEREGLALSVIEAMGMGLPVIAQPKSSMPELIEHGVNGMLIDINHPVDWSAGMLVYLQRSAQERKSHSDRVRSEMVATYDWSVIGRQYGELYRRVAL